MLEPGCTSMMELFCKKHFPADVWLGSKYASGSLDAPCKMAPLNSFILQYLCHSPVRLLISKMKKLQWQTFDC